MIGPLKHAIGWFSKQRADWALANFADRPAWSLPYFAACLLSSAWKRRMRYRSWKRGDRTPVEGSGRVSVIMTTYNSEAYVEAAIRSVLAQSYRDLELIVVDDASTDGTFDLLKSIEEQDSRVRALRLSRNSGTYFAKNVARLFSRAPFFATHDSDDMSHPDWLATHVSAHVAFPEIVASQNHYVRADSDGRIVMNRGRESRTALMCMVYKHRPVTRLLGFFDSVRMAADREHYDRLVLAFGKDRILRFEDRHYTALVRDGQLTAESKVSLAGSGQGDEDYMSTERVEYIRASERWYASRSSCDLWLPFPASDRPFPVPPRFPPHAGDFDPRSVEVSGKHGTVTVGELRAAYDKEFLNV